MLTLKEVDILPAAEIMQRRGLADGSADCALSEAALAFCAPYVPLDTGALKESGAVADTGDEVSYTVPYARVQYYEGMEGQTRGRLWFARMKADRLAELLQVSAMACGGEAVF